MKRVKFILGVVLFSFPSPPLLHAQDDGALSSLTIQTQSATYSFRTEIAATLEAKERGLMFRQVLPENQAMIFEFSPPQPVQFWMKNTVIPLDMIFVRANGVIAAIAENAVPNSLDPIGVSEPVAAVIEVAGGVARKDGIHKGDHVSGAAFHPQN